MERNIPAFSQDQKVVYNEACLCRITGTEKRCFDGVHNTEYYKLQPVGAANSCYYVPVQLAQTRIRHLMTQTQVLEIIDSLDGTEIVLSSDNRARKEVFARVLKGTDYAELLRLIYQLMQNLEHCRAAGRRPSVSDENAMHTAEGRVYPEFAEVLQISEDAVPAFIRRRVGAA